MSDRPVSELFSVVVEWALRHGGEGAHARPGCWQKDTEATNGLFALSVTLNPHMEQEGDIPPVTAKIEPQDKMGPIAICLAHPYGGSVIGFNEDALIQHFKDQPQ